METTNETSQYPHRGKVIKFLILSLVMVWGTFCAWQYGGPGFSKLKGIFGRQASPAPQKTARSEIIPQADGSFIIKWTGEGEEGFRLPDLPPGDYLLKYRGGKIVYSNCGYGAPLWGHESYNPQYEDRFRYRRIRGIRACQAILITGKVGSGRERLHPFSPGETVIFFRTSGREPVSLYFHYIGGLFP